LNRAALYLEFANGIRRMTSFLAKDRFLTEATLQLILVKKKQRLDLVAIIEKNPTISMAEKKGCLIRDGKSENYNNGEDQ
jgi:hypothetical protein